MSTRAASRPVAAIRPRGPARPDFVRRLRLVARALAGAWERWHQRHDLAELDDRLLADIGVTRAEAARESAKSPSSAWR